MRRERMSTIWPVCFMIVVGLKINVLLDMCKFTFFFGEEKGKADVFLLFIPIIISVPLRLGRKKTSIVFGSNRLPIIYG